jgi:hypothetical protein
MGHFDRLAVAVLLIDWDGLPVHRDPTVKEYKTYAGYDDKWDDWKGKWYLDYDKHEGLDNKGEAAYDYSNLDALDANEMDVYLYECLEDAKAGHPNGLIEMMAESVYPEDPGMESLVDEGGGIEGIAPRATVATAEIEVPVRAEMDIAAVMVGGRVLLGHQGLLRGGVHLELGTRLELETGETLMQLTADLNAIIDKDLTILGVLGVDGETKQAALPAGLELAILGDELEDLLLDRLGGGQPGDHLDLAAVVGARALLLVGGFVRGRPRDGVALLDDEEGILAPRQRSNADRQAEGQAGERRLDSDLLPGGGGRAEDGGAGEEEGESEKHGGEGGCGRDMTDTVRGQKFFRPAATARRGPDDLQDTLIFRWLSACGSLLNTPASLHH